MWQEQDENIYEGEIRYENDSSVAYRSRPLPDPLKTAQQSPGTQSVGGGNAPCNDKQPPSLAVKLSSKWSIAAAVLAVIAIIMQVVVIIMLSVGQPGIPINSTSLAADANGQRQSVANSCLDLKNRGQNSNGIYTIKPNEKYQEIETYCDMETGGGGWTLVAGVHENDITKKCDADDRWATYIPPGYNSYTGKTNWENKRIFGDVRRCADDDYKNSAYYSLNSRDVMVWHVPSRTPTSSSKSRATLRYRTTNHFLQNFGGNLKSLFDESYPLRRRFGYKERIVSTRSKRVIDAFVTNSAYMRFAVPNWYTYGYKNGENYRILNENMYTSSGGNQIYLNGRRFSFSVEYEKTIRSELPVFVLLSKKTQPFIMASAIAGDESFGGYYQIQVYSSRKGSLVAESLENNVTQGNFELQYRAVQHFSPTDAQIPTICEYHFIVTNNVQWRSNLPSSFKRLSLLSNSGYQNNYFKVEGNPSNFILGYVLLTRTPTLKVTIAHADAVANVILQTVASLSDLFNENININGLAVPVTFDSGDMNAVLSMVPPEVRGHVEPGYLHFRAFNLTGFPNAICPGVKVKSYLSEYVCIGGLSQDLGDQYGTCGDFAGWAGRRGAGITQEASGFSHSRANISSAILIFYR